MVAAPAALPEADRQKWSGAMIQGSQGSPMGIPERVVLASFVSSAGLTRLELEELTGLSRSVVAGVVASLVTRGELTETHQPPSAGARGRPPARYQRTALLPPVLLVRLKKDGSTTVSSLRGNGTRSRPRQCAPWSAEWETWSGSVLEAAGQLRGRARLSPRLTVLSVPFPVATSRRGSARREPAAYLLPTRSSWLREDPSPALAGLLDCPALMMNDANLAALGEAWFGAGLGRSAVFHICVADGIGAGFVFNGRLFTGAHGFSGELAHVQVAPDGPLCHCGNRGCLITQPAARCKPGRSTPKEVTEYGWLVGRVLAPLVTTLDPDCVVVDARLADKCKPFMAGLTEELARRCPPDLAGSLVVVAGELNDAELRGALAAADAQVAV
jgi:predicted NBD/HSP70 family sugar kinase